MKTTILNNWSLKLLSVGVAIIIWMIVVNYDNPYTTRTISGIPVDIINEETLTKNNQTYTVNGSQTATIRVRAPRKVTQSLRVTDFKATANFEQIYSLTNQVPITVTCTNTRVSNEEISLVTQSLQILVEDITTRKINVAVKTVGEPSEGYQVGTLRASPSIVTVRAPKSVQDQIGSVGVEINVESVSKDFSQTATLKYYNAVGTELNTSGMNDLSASMTDISVDVEILNVKNVNIAYEVTGQDNVARGYRYSGASVEPESVKISGRRSVLTDFTTLTLPAGQLDVSGASETITKTFQLSDLELPEGIELVDSPETVITVVMEIEKMETKTFELDYPAMTIKNLDENLVINNTEDAVINVTVEGLAADLDALEASELDVILDLAGMTAGTQSVDAVVTAPSGFNVVGTYSVQLDLVSRGATTNEVGAESTMRPTYREEPTSAALSTPAAATESGLERIKTEETIGSQSDSEIGEKSGEGVIE